jgi:hypothetical protein
MDLAEAVGGPAVVPKNRRTSTSSIHIENRPSALRYEQMTVRSWFAVGATFSAMRLTVGPSALVETPPPLK